MSNKETSILPSSRIAHTEVTWESVIEPGCYVEVGTGDLYRIPNEALVRGSSPIIRKESLGASRMIQLSKNPFITTVEARMVAAECNVAPNF